MPRGRKAPKLCPAEPVKWMRMVSSGRPSGAVAPCHLRAEDGAHRPVDVPDGQPDVHRLLPLEGGLAHGQERGHVERLVEAVVLLDHLAHRDLGAHLRPVEDAREVEAPRLPVVHRGA